MSEAKEQVELKRPPFLQVHPVSGGRGLSALQRWFFFFFSFDFSLYHELINVSH